MKALRITLLVFASLVLLMALTIGAIMTGRGQSMIVNRVLRDVNRDLAGAIRVGHAQVSLTGVIHIRDLAILDSSGIRILSLDSLYAKVSLRELQRKVIHVRELRAGQLRARVEIDSAGTSNVQRALTSRTIRPPDTVQSEFQWIVRADTVLIGGRETRVSYAGQRVFLSDEWTCVARMEYARNHLDYAVKFLAPRRVELSAHGAVQLDNLSSGLSLSLAVRADSALFTPFPPPLNSLGALQAVATVRTQEDSLQMEADLSSPSMGELHATAMLPFPPDTISGYGEITFNQLSPQRLLGDSLPMRLNGQLRWRRLAHADLRDGWQAALDLGECRYGKYEIRSAKASAYTLPGSQFGAAAEINTGHGYIELEGTVRGYSPDTMQLSARCGIRELSLLPFFPQVPDTFGPLNGTIVFNANGLNRERLDAAVEINLRGLRLGAYACEEFNLKGRAEFDTLFLDELRLRQGELLVQGSGRGTLGGEAEFDARFSTGELHALQPPLGTLDPALDSLYGRVEGAIHATASLAGDSLSSVRAQGHLRLDSITFGDNRLREATLELSELTFDPQFARALVVLHDLEAGGQRIDTVWCALSGSLDSARLWTEVWAKSDTFHVVAEYDVTRQADQTRVVLNTFDADVYGIHWEAEPLSGIAFQSSRVDVDGLTMRSEVGTARAAGTLQLGGDEDFVCELSGINLGELARIFKLDIPSAKANIRVQLLGPDTALTGDISVELDSVMQEGRLLADYLVLHAAADEHTTLVDGWVKWFGDTLAVLNGEIPARLSLDGGVTLLDSLPMQGEVRLFRQPLERLNPYLPFGSSVAGSVSAQALFSGTPAKPKWKGEFAVDRGEYRDSRVGVNYRDITVAGEFSADTLRIPRFEVTAGGKLTGSGWAIMAFPLPTELHLDLSLDRFEAVKGGQMEARASGELKVDGPLNRLRASGKIAVEEALYRITQATSKQIEAVDLNAELARLRGDTVSNGFTPSQIYRTTAHELYLDIPGNCWIRGGGVNLELSGSIWLHKEASADPLMNGDIKVRQGRVEFLGREFRVVQGVVRFEGPLDNPTLDVVAMDRRFADPDSVTIRVFGTLTNTQMELRGRVRGEELTPDQVVLAILRGPLAQQGSGSAVTPEEIQTAAVSAATGQLSGMIGQWAGLDVFEFKTGKGGLADLSSGSLEVGTYVTDRLFIRVVQPVQATQIGQDVSVEYRLLNWLKIRAQRSGQESSAYDLLLQIDWR